MKSDEVFLTSEQAPTSELGAPTAIRLIKADEFDDWYESLSNDEQGWIERQGFSAKRGQTAWLSSATEVVVCGWDGQQDLSTLGHLPLTLPDGIYQVSNELTEVQLIGWGLGSYQFTRYKDPSRQPSRLVLPDGIALSRIANVCDAVNLTRDLINTGAADMAPSHLAAEASEMAAQFSADCVIWEDDELLDHDCGAIHAVGRAADDPPRLIDITWGNPDDPLITLVGKGVTFDSGGLDLKTAAGMRTMKKDMGGAATAMGLAYLVMAEALPVRLRLLIPTAENAISGNAFRPGDVLSTHKGITVEIENTDAEGRLLLCDALSLASDAKPDLIVDFATLTGSARSAVGTELAAMFANHDEIADQLSASGNRIDDPVWRMPLHSGYSYMLDSQVADLVNQPPSAYAGAIIAALFLQKFIDEDIPWVHFDIMAFNTRTRPARPQGGEAMALRTVFNYLEQTYGVA
jgi:leucyl aminopeptidase